jgi:hypothetical protein
MAPNREQIVRHLEEMDESALLIDDADSAFIGFTSRPGLPLLAVYDYEKLVDVFINDGLSYEDAVEWVDFNIVGAWHGEKTPIIVMPLIDV